MFKITASIDGCRTSAVVRGNQSVVLGEFVAWATKQVATGKAHRFGVSVARPDDFLDAETVLGRLADRYTAQQARREPGEAL